MGLTPLEKMNLAGLADLLCKRVNAVVRNTEPDKLSEKLQELAKMADTIKFASQKLDRKEETE